MSWLLRFIPGGSTLWMLAGAAFVSVALWGGIQTKRLGWAKAETQQVKDAWTLDTAQRTATALDAATKYRAHEAELTAKVKGAQDEYNALQGQHAKALLDNRAVLVDNNGLRSAIAAYASGGAASSDPGATDSQRAARLGALLAEAISLDAEILRSAGESTAGAEDHADAVRSLLASWPTRLNAQP